MARGLISALIMCLLLGAISAAFGQDAVKLELKFTPGELLRYKMVGSVNVDMQIDMPNAPQMPTIPIQVVGVVRQRTKRVLPNGDAEIAAAVESMKMIMGNEAKEFPVNQIPVITMVISRNGTVKSVQGLEKFNDACGAFGKISGTSNVYFSTAKG